MEYSFRTLTTWTGARTKPEARKYFPFRKGYSDTLRALEYELLKLCAKQIVIEVAIPAGQIRLDGRPRSDAQAPSFPGVRINFQSKHGPLVFQCDRCRNWQDNLRAIGLTLERLRLADLYGVTKSGEQYRGWTALPPPILTPPPMTVETAAMIVCNFAGDPCPWKDLVNVVANYRLAYREACKRTHPDTGGSEADFKKLQEARRILDKHHGL